MLRVRYPNGAVVQYNTATRLYRGAHGYELYTALKEKGGTWVASIQASSGAIIEPCSVAPCSVVGPSMSTVDLVNHVVSLCLQRGLSALDLIALKRAVRDFNAKTGRWK